MTHIVTDAYQMTQKEAFEQKMTAQLLLWDAKLRRKKEVATDIDDHIYKKFKRSWQALDRLRAIDPKSAPHLRARVTGLIAEAEDALVGLRSSME